MPRPKQTLTARVSCSCATCACVVGQQWRTAQAAQLTSRVCSATCGRKCARNCGTASSSTACQLCCCWHHPTWHTLITFLHSSKNHSGTPSCAMFFPYGMQLFCFSSGRGIPHRTLSMVLATVSLYVFTNSGAKAWLQSTSLCMLEQPHLRPHKHTQFTML